MLPEKDSADFEIRQAVARIRKEYEQRLACADPKAAKRISREMSAKIRRERLRIRIKHSFALGRVIR
jgi:hypothetical protein